MDSRVDRSMFPDRDPVIVVITLTDRSDRQKAVVLNQMTINKPSTMQEICQTNRSGLKNLKADCLESRQQWSLPHACFIIERLQEAVGM